MYDYTVFGVTNGTGVAVGRSRAVGEVWSQIGTAATVSNGHHGLVPPGQAEKWT